MRRDTVQKKIVYATVDALGHSTTNKIIEIMQERFPEISVATIYRNLDVLVDEGLISRLSTNYKEDIFESNSHGSHDHFICTECGEIIDVPKSQDLIGDYDGDGNLIISVNKTFYGICKDCAKNKKS